MVVALSAVVGCCRPLSAADCCGARSRSVRAGVWWSRCRLLSAADCCGAVLVLIAADLAPLEGVVVALSAVVGRCRLLTAAALS